MFWAPVSCGSVRSQSGRKGVQMSLGKIRLSFEFGMRRHRRLLRTLAIVLIASSVLWPYTVSFGDTQGAFTLVNDTRYYLHAFINNKSYVYIAPGGVIVHEVSAPATVFVDVSYSPGQGVEGKASKTFESVLHTFNGSSTDCSSSNSNNINTCNSTTGVTSSVDPIRWDVTATDLTIPNVVEH